MTDEMRCAECDCENGGADCSWIKTPPELLPCPFCGGGASLMADADHSAAFIIITHCSDTCTIADHWDWRPSMSEAIAAWNTRADLVPKVKPLNEDDRAEIIDSAYSAMRKRNRGVGGQLVTEWDSIESYVIQETERRILSELKTPETET